MARSKQLKPPFIPKLENEFDHSYFHSFYKKSNTNSPQKPSEKQYMFDSPERGGRIKVKPLGDFRMQKINNTFENF